MSINWTNTVDIFVNPLTIVTSSSNRDTLTLQEALDAFVPTRESETLITLATSADTQIGLVASWDIIALQWHETNDWRLEMWRYEHGYAIIFGRTFGCVGPFFVYSHHRGNIYRQLTTRMCVCEEDDGPVTVPSGDIDALKAHIKTLL